MTAGTLAESGGVASPILAAAATLAHPPPAVVSQPPGRRRRRQWQRGQKLGADAERTARAAGEHRLRPLLAPRSLALVGASPRPGSVGLGMIEAVRGFPGRLHLVNPGYSEIQGQ